jgi:hypothetical protein
MKSKIVKTLVVAPLLALSSLAFAGQPVALDNAQMDGVTAGAIAGGDAIATAIGAALPGSTAATSTSAFGSATVVSVFTTGVTTIRAVLTLSGASSASSSL